MVDPTSPTCSVYELDVAPLINEHAFPDGSQSSQAYGYPVGLPDHVPFDVISVWPSCAVPLTTGAAAADGGCAVITALRADVAVAVPPELPAVTIARSVDPTSPVRTLKELNVAPLITEHAFPDESQSSQAYEYVVGLPDQLPFDVVRVWPDWAPPVITGGVVLEGRDDGVPPEPESMLLVVEVVVELAAVWFPGGGLGLLPLGVGLGLPPAGLGLAAAGTPDT
jgi:hypothetical protein